MDSTHTQPSHTRGGVGTHFADCRITWRVSAVSRCSRRSVKCLLAKLLCVLASPVATPVRARCEVAQFDSFEVVVIDCVEDACGEGCMGDSCGENCHDNNNGAPAPQCHTCPANTSNPTKASCHDGCTHGSNTRRYNSYNHACVKKATPCAAMADHYQTDQGAPARACPPNSTSAPGSTERTDCTCVFGHFDAAAVSDQVGFGPLCKACRAVTSCPQGTYLTGACTTTSDYACTPCPADSETNASGATSVAQCRCLKGFHDAAPTEGTRMVTGVNTRRALFSSKSTTAAVQSSAQVGWSWNASWVNASSSDSKRAGIGTPSSLCAGKPRNCFSSAMDGSASTAWGCNTPGGMKCWLQFNLGAPRHISGFSLLTMQGGLVSATLQYRMAEGTTPWKDALRIRLPAVSPNTTTDWRFWPATTQFWKLDHIVPASRTYWPAVRETRFLVVPGAGPHSPTPDSFQNQTLATVSRSNA